MKKFLLYSLLISASVLSAASKKDIYTSGWWTGPLFASHAKTTPRGKINIEPYLGYFATQGNYNNSWGLDPASHFFSVSPSIFVSLGITDTLECAIEIPWLFNRFRNKSANGLSDVSFQGAYQFLQDDHGGPTFDTLFFIREYFPTGRYSNLNPLLQGADLTGYGMFTTLFGFNLQKVFLLSNCRLLRLRLNAAYELPAVAHVKGLNAYGGGFGTKGKVWADSTLFLTIAHEIQFTQNWVFACDYMYQHGGQGKFSGDPGSTSGRSSPFAFLPDNGYPAWDSFSVAPAMEYNFSANVGMIAGIWVSVAGRNNSAFISPIIALNATF